MGLPSGPLYRFTFGGPVSPTDNWLVGVYCTGSDGNQTDATLNTWANTAFNSFNAKFWTAAASPWKVNCLAVTSLFQCRVFQYLSGTLTGEGISTAATVVGTGATAKPAYTAACFSLRTDAFGRSARGRSYFPATAVPLLAGTLQMSLAQQNVDNYAAFLNEFLNSTVTGSAMIPCVVSQTQAIARPITSVKLDTIPDTQRGRNKMVATNVFSHTVP
jgi:hypothetical protein